MNSTETATKEYKVVNGTSHDIRTPDRVIQILENARISRNRLVIHYGDTNTGKAWGDKETGYIGRSTGDNKIPLVVHNSRSFGGGGLLDYCIVRIETSRGKTCLYNHPLYNA